MFQAGQEEYERLRLLSYPGVRKVFFLLLLFVLERHFVDDETTSSGLVPDGHFPAGAGRRQQGVLPQRGHQVDPRAEAPRGRRAHPPRRHQGGSPRGRRQKLRNSCEILQFYIVTKKEPELNRFSRAPFLTNKDWLVFFLNLQKKIRSSPKVETDLPRFFLFPLPTADQFCLNALGLRIEADTSMRLKCKRDFQMF